jgi:hypothetical protein
VEEITSAVETYGAHTGGEGALGDGLAYDGSGLDAGLTLALCGKSLIVGCGCGKGLAGLIVDYLSINLLVASEDYKTRALGSAADVLADTVVNPFSSCYST